jgi:hypothetical protein
MKTFPHTTPTGHTYHEPTDWKQLCEWSMNRAQGSIECWDDAELPPDETPAMFTIAWNTAVRATEALESAEKALWHHHETMGLETDPEHCWLCQDAGVVSGEGSNQTRPFSTPYGESEPST